MANNQTLDLKKKFGLMLCYLFDAGFSLEYISHKIVHDSFFLFFENNDALSFLQLPIETIVEKVFLKRVYIDYSKPVQSELFWAGTMYVSLLLNKRVPLQRSVLILPLAKMVSLFDPYHEMNDAQLLQRYDEEEQRQSVLKLLNDQGLSMRQLSMILGINLNTLLSYTDNRKLFAMSSENASKLASFFGVPIVMFRRESLFAPDVHSLFRDPFFRQIYVQAVCEYLGLKTERVVAIETPGDKPSIEALLREGKVVLDLDHQTVIKSSNNASRNRYLDAKEKGFIDNIALERFAKQQHIDLLF